MPTESGFADAIMLSKDALKKWRDYYLKITNELPKDHPSYQFMIGLYIGKADVLINLLEYFEKD